MEEEEEEEEFLAGGEGYVVMQLLEALHYKQV
jgi:hypothetical protein